MFWPHPIGFFYKNEQDKMKTVQLNLKLHLSQLKTDWLSQKPDWKGPFLVWASHFPTGNVKNPVGIVKFRPGLPNT
jgi:hypothetical protein